MSARPSRLRLFPLARTVLFPGASLPLTVFEPRYHRLVAECVAEDVPFGVVRIRHGVEVGGAAEPVAVGTTARIMQAARLPDGRLRLMARGEARFRIERLERDHSPLRARVSYPADERAGQVTPERRARARKQQETLERLRTVAQATYDAHIALPADAGPLADCIAEAVLTAPDERQAFLETLDVPRRLEAALAAQEHAIVRAHGEAQLRAAARWGSVAARN